MNNIKELLNRKGARLVSGYTNYYVTEDGDVFSTYKGSLRELKKSSDKDGYLSVGLFQGNKVSTKRVHRLVAREFIGESSLHVNHKDFNKKNNHVSNLEYVTQHENMRWNIINRVSHIGELSKTSKLNWSKVLTIYTLGNFRTNKSLSDYANVSVNTIELIRQGKAWRHLFEYSPPTVRKRLTTHAKQGWTNSKRKLSDGDMENIIGLISDGSTQAEIAKKFGVHISTVEYRLKKLRENSKWSLN